MSALAPGGALALEVGEGQAAPTAALLAELGFVDVLVTPDLAGIDRVVEGRPAVSDVDGVVRSIRTRRARRAADGHGLRSRAARPRARGRRSISTALKGRDAIQPTAVVFASVDSLCSRLRLLEAERRDARCCARCFPGRTRWCVPNPERSYAWLNAGAARHDRGAGTCASPAHVAEIVRAPRAVVATSANLPGEPDPRRLADVPAAILEGVVGRDSTGVSCRACPRP